ncbi:hypothetical protein HOG16_00030 [Candidatus Woesearchaeota archaeon]|jgi:hypothetical protein|nr:hypothetical protein [Candidatus Woesearchaeota archaeon]MBT4322327.1 hypothetical protein [Candidatus Woesearchaeota archaeon]MBT4630940.1 hypothetical protein [Candidatus Woesearchaeota archaeon]
MVDSKINKLVSSNLQLQKLSINLVESNNNLVKRIDKLVSLFEEASKNISSGSSEHTTELNKKINELIEQNKQLARGLILMEEKIRRNPPRVNASPIPKL